MDVLTDEGLREGDEGYESEVSVTSHRRQGQDCATGPSGRRIRMIYLSVFTHKITSVANCVLEFWILYLSTLT